MKKSLILALALSAVLLTGCDQVRSFLGRPTSADIEAKKQAILAAQEAERLAQEEAERIVRHAADSVAARDTLSRMRAAWMPLSKIRGARPISLEHTYCIVIGSFQRRYNADRQLERARQAGYDGTILRYRYDMHTVAVCPSDDFIETYRNLRAIRASGLSKEAWILVNE